MTENDEKDLHWHGWKNRSIRHVFYTRNGAGLVNEFRNVFYIPLGFYIVLKIHDHAFLFGVFLLSMPVLDFIGWLQVHHLGKVTEWLNIKFATHYGKKGFDNQTEMIDLLKEISEKLDRK